MLKRKLRDAGLLNDVPITEIPLGGKFSVGPFELEMITMTHSIPEPNALAVRTKFGTVFHTGDWKIDPEPLLGEVTDEATLQKHRRAGRARHGVRQHQRVRRGRGGLRGDDPRQPREAGEDAARTGWR